MCSRTTAYKQFTAQHQGLLFRNHARNASRNLKHLLLSKTVMSPVEQIPQSNTFAKQTPNALVNTTVAVRLTHIFQTTLSPITTLPGLSMCHAIPSSRHSGCERLLGEDAFHGVPADPGLHSTAHITSSSAHAQSFLSEMKTEP